MRSLQNTYPFCLFFFYGIGFVFIFLWLARFVKAVRGGKQTKRLG